MTSFFPSALKPVVVGFLIGFAVVGIWRGTHAGKPTADKIVHVRAGTPSVHQWVVLR